MMENVKERIIGAVTVMGTEEAKQLWAFIENKYSAWEHIEEIEPDEWDLEMLQDIKQNADCTSFPE